MGPLGGAFALCLLLPWASAGPVAVTNCVSECRSPANPKLRYKIGHSYTYNYETKTLTALLGTTTDQALLEVKGQAVVTVRGPCDMVLQLAKTSIAGVEGKVDVSELDKRPLLFSFQDGVVDSVCPNEDDPAWVVNVKRSVLSMLQHTALSADVSESNVIENDIVGRCPTTYEVDRGSVVGTSIKVVKTKIPNQCSGRIGRHSAIPSTPYQVPAELQTVPLLNSTSQCTQQINHGIVESTRCREFHVFNPLSSEQGGGARTEVITQLTLSGNAPAGSIKLSGKFIKSSILFDPKGVNLQGESDKDISSVLKLICQSLSSDSPAQASQLFSQLVYAVRKASTKEVKNAWGSVKGKKFCNEGVKIERIFLDALPQAGNAAAITQMVELLKEDKISERQALGWYVSLPLAKVVTDDSIKAVTSLVDKVQNIPVALLGISGLAQRYCADKDTDCSKDEEIAKLNNKIAKIIPLKCKADPKEETKILSVLKALGNMGIYVPEIETLVKDCIREPSAPISVRVAAAEAFRNSPCSKQVENTLVAVLTDSAQDSELRIAAYLGLVRCPTSGALGAIQNLLYVEKYNQVGAFIKSHLDNILKNPTPGKQELARLITGIVSNNTYPDDGRRYSQNYGLSSHFCNVNNAGWDLDSNVVFSSKSFIPRSTNVDLTLYLFGQSVNLFEVGIRTENLERVLESYLGPDGTITREGLGSIVKKGSDVAESFGDAIFEGINSALRPKRSPINKNDVAAFEKVVVDVKKDHQAGVKLDTFIRIFGTEIGIVNYRRGFDQKPAILEGIRAKLLAAAKSIIEGAKKAEIDVARSWMFLDTAATFPTVGGLPIKLAINGTTTVALGLESQLDLAAVMKDPSNANLKLKVSPTAVTDISAAMTVDMSVVRTGVKMVATLHSAQAVEFSAKLQQGSNVEVKVELPKSRLTLLDFKSEVLIIQQRANEAEKSKKITIVSEAKYNHGGCSERLSFITGMRFCASSSLQIPRPLADPAKDPAPAFPLSGHGSFSLYYEKTEPSMKGFVLSGSLKTEGQTARSVSLTFDTPGAKTNRKVTVTGIVKLAPNLGFKVDAKGLGSTYGVEGELVNSNDVKAVQVKVNKEKQEYFGRIQLKVTRGAKEAVYAPSLELGYPGQARGVVWEGRVAYVKGNSFEFSSKPSGAWSNQPWAIQGSVVYDNTATAHKFSIPFAQIVTPLGKASVSTAVGRQDRSYLANLELKYGAQDHGVTLQSLIEDRSQKDQRQYKTSLVYKSTRFPVSNVDFKWDVQHTNELVSNTVILIHGPEAQASQNRLLLSQFSQMKGRILQNFHLENKFEVSYPRLRIGGKLAQVFKFDDKSISGNLQVTADTQKLLDADLNILLRAKDPKTIYEASAKLAYPGRSITFRDVGKKLDDKRYSLSPSLDIKPGKKYELSAQATVTNDRGGLAVGVDADLRIEGTPNPIKVRHNSLIGEGPVITMDNKFDWDGLTQATFEVKVNPKASVPTASVKLNWKERVDAVLDAKISRGDSKLDLDLKLLRLQRRIKASGSLRNDDNIKTSVSANVAWDADKDQTKQLGVELGWNVDVSDKINVGAKGALNLFSQRYGVSLNGGAKVGQGFANGEYSGRIELELPLQKTAALSVSLSNVLRDKRIANRFESELVLPSSAVYRINLNNAVDDLDRNLVAFSAITDLTLKTPATEEVKLRLDTRRAVKSDRRNTDVKILVTAPKFGHTLDWSASVEVKKDNIRVVSNYQRGPMILTLEATGKLTTAGSKVTAEGFIEVKAPKLAWQQVKLNSVTTYQFAPDNLELAEKLTIQYQNFKTITLDARSKFGSSAIDVTVNLETPNQSFRRQGFSLSGQVSPVLPRVEGSLGVNWSSPDQRQARELRLDLEMQSRDNTILFRTSVATPVKNYESAEFRFEGRSLNNARTLEADVAAHLAGEKAKLTARLQRNPNQYELDVTLNLPSSNPIRFFARYGIQGTIHSTEGRVDWGSGSLTAKGSLKYVSSENFEATLSLDSPFLQINSYEITVLNKIEGKKRKAELSIKIRGTVLGSVKTSYERKDSKTGVNIQGTGEVVVKDPMNSGAIKFTYEDKIIDKSDEKGNEYKFNMDATSGDLPAKKLTSTLKKTNKEISFIDSICVTARECYEVSFSHKDTSAKGSHGFEGFAYLKSKEGSKEESLGYRYKHLLAGTKYEFTADKVYNKEKNEFVGFKAYRKDGEYGIEVYTPKKTAAAVLEVEVKGKAPKQQFKSTISLWLDKNKQAKNKFVIVTLLEQHKLDDMDGHTFALTLKHPALPRELEYRAEYHLGTKNNIFHGKVDIDAFSQAHQRWALESRLKVNNIARGSNFTLETELRSKGTDVAVKLLVFGGAAASELFAGANLKFLDKETIDKELFVNFNLDGDSTSLTLGSPLKQMEFTGQWELGTFYSHRQVKFTGTSNIFSLSPTVFTLSANTLPRAEVKIYNKASPENIYQIGGGLIDDQNFEVGLFKQFGITKKDLAAGRISLPEADELSTRFTWSVQELRSFAAVARSRGATIRTEAAETFKTLREALAAHRLKWKAFDKFVDETGRLVSDYKQQVDKIAADTKDESLQTALGNIGAATSTVVDLLDVATAGFDLLGELVSESAGQLTDSYRDLKASVAEGAVLTKGYVVSVAEGVANYAAKVFEVPASYLETLLGDWTKSGGLLANVQSSYAGLKARAAAYLEALPTRAAEIAQQLLGWLNFNGGSSQYLSQLAKGLSLNNLSDRVAAFVVETIVNPVQEVESTVVAKYPEFTRFFYRIKRRAIRLIEEIFDLDKEKTKEKPLAQEVVESTAEEFFRINTEKGEIFINVPLYKDVPSLRRIGDLFEFDFSEDFDSLEDLYKKYRARYSPLYAKTRLRRQALLIGSQGYVTFDNYFYDLKGNCQYLLAHDFLNNDFTVAIKYEDTSSQFPKKTITFADQNDQVAISSTKVLVNDKPVASLPVKLKSLTVSRDGDVVTVRRGDFAVLNCDVEDDVCSFEISAFYFGRTRGLWGNFNNEPADDLSLPNGQVVQDVATFANEWRLSKTCKDKVETLPAATSNAKEACAILLSNDDSVLRDCFGVISPKPYDALCQKFVTKAKGVAAVRTAVSTVSIAYATACTRFDVFFTNPLTAT